MKKFIPVAFSLLFLFSCGKKDKFECDAQNQMAPADDSALIFVPTAFSPNRDGMNDIFKYSSFNLKSIDFSIYSSDNKLLFQTTDLGAGWSGVADEETGVNLYHYKIAAITNQGNSISKCGAFYSYKCLPDNFDCTILIFGDQFDPSTPEGYLHGASQENFVPCNP